MAFSLAYFNSSAESLYGHWRHCSKCRTVWPKEPYSHLVCVGSNMTGLRGRFKIDFYMGHCRSLPRDRCLRVSPCNAICVASKVSQKKEYINVLLSAGIIPTQPKPPSPFFLHSLCKCHYFLIICKSICIHFNYN